MDQMKEDKSETRNPKSETNPTEGNAVNVKTEDLKFETSAVPSARTLLRFELGGFVFTSDFEFRHSDLGA